MKRHDDAVADDARGATARRPTVIFVAGVSRSGSTMLDLMLGNRPDSFSCGEVYARYRPFRPHHLEPVCACGAPVATCPVWRQIGEVRAPHLHRRIVDSLGATTVVDSSKNLVWIADASRWALRDGLEPRIVLAWRHPRQIAYSYWKRGSTDWADHLLTYVDRLDQLRRPYEVVLVDQLVAEPGPTLDLLCARLGTTAVGGQERFWEGAFHHLFGSGGTGAQVGRAQSALAEPTLPDEFLDYWAGLPPVQRSTLESLHQRLADHRPGPTTRPPARPPSWYVRSRVAGVRTSASLRRRERARRRKT